MQGKVSVLNTFPDRKTGVQLPLWFGVCTPLFFYALFLFIKDSKERMDIRSSRHCGNVYNRPYHGAVGNVFAGCGKALGLFHVLWMRFPSAEWPVMHISTVLIIPSVSA